jgi:glycerate kinase
LSSRRTPDHIENDPEERMHILVAPDKFKGSLSAAEASAALGAGWRDGWPAEEPLEIERLPMADGGEGAAEAIHDALQGPWGCAHCARSRRSTRRSALCLGRARWRADGVLEMSSASGFTLVS